MLLEYVTVRQTLPVSSELPGGDPGLKNFPSVNISAEKREVEQEEFEKYNTRYNVFFLEISTRFLSESPQRYSE